MITRKRFLKLPRMQQMLLSGSTYTYVPRNKSGIRSGYYMDYELADLLREHAGDKEKVTFLVDMMF